MRTITLKGFLIDINGNPVKNRIVVVELHLCDEYLNIIYRHTATTITDENGEFIAIFNIDCTDYYVTAGCYFSGDERYHEAHGGYQGYVYCY